VLEVDLVFPRNETYAPTAYVPIVFALRNGNADLGLAIKVTDTTVEVPRRMDRPGGTCAVLASSPTPTPDPCLVNISSAVAASMSASWTARICNILLSLDPRDNCPKDNAGPQRLAVAGVACLTVAFGAFGFLLA
jgi:hypothetical protein